MTNILIVLIVLVLTFLASVLLTPAARSIGHRFRILDHPGGRKTHQASIPRTGGLSIFLVFFGALILLAVIPSEVAVSLGLNPAMPGFIIGGCLVFAIGWLDDILGLNAKIKLVLQILAASCAYGLGLNAVPGVIFGITIHSHILGFVITVGWLLLFINAVNLIDGMDGLAGGIVFFSTTVLFGVSLVIGNLLTAALYAALSGALLGFKIYNKAPATIFLGDAGSYFLGYAVASLSIVGNMKMHVGALSLFPAIALGLPIIDTMLAAATHFVRGQKMFQADLNHIHHRLQSRGYSVHEVIRILYFFSILLCAIGVAVLALRGNRPGWFVFILGAASLLVVIELKYFGFLRDGAFRAWALDVADEIGIRRARRRFFGMQLDLGQAKTMAELWPRVIFAFEEIGVDYGALVPSPFVQGAEMYEWTKTPANPNGPEQSLFLRIPLQHQAQALPYDALIIRKVQTADDMGPFFLKRIEHLRRTLTRTLGRFPSSRLETKPRFHHRLFRHRLERFSWKKTAQETMAVYEKVLSTRIEPPKDSIR